MPVAKRFASCAARSARQATHGLVAANKSFVVASGWKELDDAAWALERDAITTTFLGIGADEFVRRFTAGEFDEVEPDGLMAVLAFFPELD